jgi:hypothetical protein
MAIFRASIISTFLYLLGAVVADETLAPSSMISRDLRKVKAQPVSKQDRKPKQQNEPSQSQPKGQQNDKKPNYYDPGTERMLSETRTTVLNVDLSSLTAGEYLFFEDTLREAFESVYGVTVKSAIVQRAEKPSGPKHSRNLRGEGPPHVGHRALDEYFYEHFSWFDIFALLEFTTCRLCGPADDDDDPYFDDDYYNFGGFRKLGGDDDEQVDGFFVAKKTMLETNLCVALQESPFENFQGAQGCQILIAA